MGKKRKKKNLQHAKKNKTYKSKHTFEYFKKY